jgi:cytoskeletal protein CcmA (bactofilin family)
MGIFGKTESKEPTPQRPPQPGTPPAPRAKATPPPPSTSQCIIGPRTVVKGEITGDEAVVVEGAVEGTIQIKADLKVGSNGRVKATVSAQSIVVAGEVEGDCQAEQRVHIEATGKLSGNIRAPRVVIVEGATFKGNSDMSPRPGSGGGSRP